MDVRYDQDTDTDAKHWLKLWKIVILTYDLKGLKACTDAKRFDIFNKILINMTYLQSPCLFAFPKHFQSIYWCYINGHVLI